MFSELVDRAVHLAGRPDAVTDFAYAANEVMREICKHSDWDDDTHEEIVAVPSDTRSVDWTPEVGRRLMRRIEFVIDGCGCEPTMVRPSARMRSLNEAGFYYASGSSYVFAQVCNPLKIYYFRYWPWLQYYPHNARPAVFNVRDGDWGGATEANIALVSNWLLERHNSVVLEGTMAAFYRAKQDPRNQLHYSAFKQGLIDMVDAESARELLAR